MLVHKGGQINNVQLITGVRIAEMSQLQNCKVKIFKEHSSRYFTRKRNGGCQLRRKSRGEGGGLQVIVKMQKRGEGGMDVYKELKLLWKCKKKSQSGGGGV